MDTAAARLSSPPKAPKHFFREMSIGSVDACSVFYAWKYSYDLVCCAVTEQQCLTAAMCVTAPASCFDTGVCLVV